MEELDCRVELLERLLEGTTTPYRRRLRETDEMAERNWAASSLLARLLQHAEPAHVPIDRTIASGVLANPGLLDVLEKDGQVRWILGKMGVAHGAWSAVIRAEDTTWEGIPGLPPPLGVTLGALEALIDLLRIRERQPLAIRLATAEALVDAHARAHPATPSFAGLLALGWLARDGARVILMRGQELLDRAAAELWLAQSAMEPRERFDTWFARVGEDGAVDAAAHLPAESKAVLLDEMLRRVLEEPDLGSWDAEWRRAIAALDEPRPGLDRVLPPTDADLADVLVHWTWIEKWLGEPALNDMRDAIGALIHAIVLHEPLGAYARRSRIARLLEAGRRSPYLVRAVAGSIARSRPAAVARLLTRPELLRFGVTLLADLKLDDDARIGWTDTQQSRHARRVRLVWSEGVAIALHVIAGQPPNEGADTLAGVLVPLAREATAETYFSTEVRSRADAELRLDETLALLDKLEAAAPVNRRRPRVLPGLLPALVEAIRRRSVDESPPSGALRLLFWLLDADERVPTSAVAATAIAEVMHAALRAKQGSWVHDHRALAALDWGRVAGALDAEAFDAWIVPVPALEGVEPRNLANRRRFRLRILVRALGALGESPARREAIETALAEELADHAPRGKSEPSNVFDRMLEGIGVGADVEDLTRLVARTVDMFSPGRREEAIRRWLGVTRDPALLLRAAAAMHAADARDAALARLDQLDLGKELADESTLRVAEMAGNAIELGARELAGRLLSAGEQHFGSGRLQEGWRAASLRPQLSLAATSGDRAAFEALAGASGELHAFQRGILELQSGDAVRAVTLFEQLVEANPRAAGAQVNLFAARLRAAEAVPEDRTRRIEQALEAWQSVEAQLPLQEREQVSSSAMSNVLKALDALGRDEDLDRQIQALSLPLRLNRKIDELITRVMLRREEAERTSRERREAVLGPPSPSFVSDEVRRWRATPGIDLLIFTALTEEGQVVEAVMAEVARRRDAVGDLTLYDVCWPDGRTAVVATACAHHLGAVNMAVFAAPRLKDFRPRSATLVGIAAAVDTKDVALGDVPFASEVLGYDDIAVESSTLSFRTSGFQVDPRMLRAAGALRISRTTYQPWQDDCVRHIHRVVDEVNAGRRGSIQKPTVIERPHLQSGIVAGGPFLLRDRNFRDALRRHPTEQALAGKSPVSVAGPVHPKLVSAEMESKGFMAAAHDTGVPATVIKGISDDGDERKAELEQKTGGFYRVFACSNAVLAAVHVLAQVRE